MALGELTQFNRIILNMILEDETMSRREKRRARLAVYFRPRLMREIESSAWLALSDEEHGLSQAALGDGDFDWDKFLDFLKELFEFILKLIMGGI